MMKNAKYILLVVGIAVLSSLIYQRRTVINQRPDNTASLNPKDQGSIANLLETPMVLDSVIYFASVDHNETVSLNFADDPNSSNYIFILLNKGDCYDCYRDIPFWNGLSDLSSTVRPFVVIKPEDQKYMFEFVKGQNIHVPVLIDINHDIFTILDKISHAFTPVCIFVNNEGVVLAATKSNYGNKESQNLYLNYIKENL